MIDIFPLSVYTAKTLCEFKIHEAPDPDVLFMDEPLSNLDAKLRLEMRYELQRLVKIRFLR